MKHINIPEPCSENWNEMSPTEKGAFCQKCAIDVYDFTNKSGDEIRDILRLNLGGHVCGRIQSKQLKELNDDFSAWRITNKRSFDRAWIFSLLVVFGLTLFSCEEDEVSVVNEIQRTAQTFLSDVSEFAPSDELKSTKDSNVKQVEDMGVTGQIHIDDVSETQRVPVDECFEILGELELPEEMPEPLINKEDIKDIRVIEYGQYMAGAIAISHTFENHLVETSNASCEIEELAALTFPNPAQNETTLKVTIPQDGTAEIQLYSMAGQQIRNIYSGRVSKGESEYLVDISDLETGTYLFLILTGDKKETVKFSKI